MRYRGVKDLIVTLKRTLVFFASLSSLILFSKTTFQPTLLQRSPQSYSKEENSFFRTEQHFSGFTPLSPSVWNSYNEELKASTEVGKYLFREAYLLEADRRALQTERRVFTVPMDDLSSTQRRILSPFKREEEERQRRDYAESVSAIVLNKGLPEYVVQVLGFQKLREGVKKVERAVALDVTLSNPKVTNDGSIQQDKNPWRYRGIALPYQRSYRMGLTNSIWTIDVQGGGSAIKGDRLYAEVTARWSRYLQSNTYKVLTSTAISSFSFFFSDDLSVSYSYLNEIRNQTSTPDVSKQSIGFNYIF
jgi:hypothetical protein